MTEKPECQLTETDGNIYALTGRARVALKRAGLRAEAEEMTTKIAAAKSYDEALQVIMQYVDAY